MKCERTAVKKVERKKRRLGKGHRIYDRITRHPGQQRTEPKTHSTLDRTTDAHRRNREEKHGTYGLGYKGTRKL